MKTRRHIVAASLLVTLLASSFTPFFAKPAQAGIADGVAGLLGAAKVLPHVPTGDTVQTLITTVLNTAAIAIAQAMVQKIVDSTIVWANSGFENKPVYVTNTNKYFRDAADSAVGGVINELAQNKLGSSLCSPFQAQIVISLRKYYSPTYTPACTFTQVKNNVSGAIGSLGDFYHDFNYGGWKSWLQTTQDSNNNPYGAFINAQVEIDSRLTKAIGIKNQDLSVNGGFLSTKDCLEKNPSNDVLDAIESGTFKGEYDSIDDSTDPEQVANDKSEGVTLIDDSKAAGECIFHGPTKTPGTLIKSQLDKVLPSGLNQLVSVQQFDQLVNAFMSGLLQKYVFNKKGLAGYSSSDQSDAGNNGTQAPEELQCFVSTQQATANDTIVTWSISSAIAGAAEFRWKGDEIENSTSYNAAFGYATGTSVSLIYKTPTAIGTKKTMTLSASTTDFLGNHRDVPAVACKQGVTVSQFKPITVACFADKTIAKLREPVVWTAKISGGSGQFDILKWDGSQSHTPGCNNDDSRTYPADNTADPHIDWPYALRGSVGILNRKDCSDKTEHTYEDNKQGTDGFFYSALTRKYEEDKTHLGRMTASIQVIDKDPRVPPVTQACSGDVLIND